MSSRRSANEFVCGACHKTTGYVSHWVCPHCGRDLKKVGISRRVATEAALPRLVRHLRTHGIRVRREPRCGQCSYGIHPEQGFRCPECEADLREVGVWVSQGISWPPAIAMSFAAAYFTAFLSGPVIDGWVPEPSRDTVQFSVLVAVFLSFIVAIRCTKR
ncbi:MAG: hypothetical protein AAGG38_05875 [Planctomycetota bacterium]